MTGEPGHGHREGGEAQRALGEEVLRRGHGPQQDHGGEDVEGAPGADHLAEGVLLLGGLGRLRGAGHALRGPHVAHREQGDHGQQAGREIRQLGTHEPQQATLHRTEDHRGDQRREPGLAQAAHPVDHPHEQERNEERERLEQQHEGSREFLRLHAGDLRAHEHGHANGAVGTGGHVGHEAQHCGAHGREPQLHEQCRADRNGHAEACHALQERAERKRNEQHLHALVSGDRGDRGADHVEAARAHAQPVQPHRHDDDVRDGPQRGQQPQQTCTGRGGDGHVEHEQCHQDLHHQRDEPGFQPRELEQHHAGQEHDYRDRGHERGEGQAAQGVKRLGPHWSLHDVRG